VRTQYTSVAAAGPTLRLEGDVPPGTVLDGRYEVLSNLGEGGFAVVLKAKQLSTEQIVAVKLLRTHRITARSLADLELKRFAREMKLIGTLRHPHVGRLIDSGSRQVERPGAPVSWSASGEHTQGGEEAPPEPEAAQRTRVVRLPYIVMEYLDGEPL